MDWKNLYDKASESLQNYREKNIALQEKYSRMSDDQLINKYKRSRPSNTMELITLQNEIDQRGIKHRLR